MRLLDRIRQWLRRPGDEAQNVAGSAEPDASPPSSFGQPEREASTNAQVQGAEDEPWPK